MKRLIHILFHSILILSFQLTFSQKIETTSDGPIPEVKFERNHTQVHPIQYLANIAYGYSSTDNYTLSMTIPQGAFNSLSYWTPPHFASSMVKSSTGQYYITEIGPPAQLYQMNENTGVVTLVGNITGMDSEQPNGISYNPIDSMYYIISRTKFYSFNLETLNATLIGPFNSGGIMISLCFDANGVCYAYDIGTDNAYTVNLTTGAATLLGPLGFDANYAQGMSYDYESNTIYLSAFNNTTSSGQLRIMDPITGMTTLLTSWGYYQIAPFAIDTQIGAPSLVGSPSNPNPPDDATGISVYNTTLSWINGIGTTNVEVWFSYYGSLEKVYDGTAITSWQTSMSLEYQTTYKWFIVCKDTTCSTYGPVWKFTTEFPPGYVFIESFNNLSCWTAIGPLGQINWSISPSNNSGGNPPELKLSWSPSFNGLSQFLSCQIEMAAPYCLSLSLRHFCDWYADPAPFMGLAITYDGGLTSTILWEFQPVGGNVGPEEIQVSFMPASTPFRLILYLNGDSFNIDDWYVDDIIIVPYLSCPPPYPPSNLTAQAMYNPNPIVQLNWQDNAWNEQGFNIFRKPGTPNDPGDYQLVGTAQMNAIQFIDVTVSPESTYTYRVFAYNVYGSNGSNTASITVPIPVELISFTNEVDDDDVTLLWQTATEINNSGFEIQRLQDSKIEELHSWKRIGFVAGKGTTTEIQNYSFQDKPEPGKYKYRLKQIDFDGSFAYSPEIEAEVKAPLVFSLEQNFPNPFNPSTKISWQSPIGSWQTLKVYDVLGNEVAVLVDEFRSAGSYEIEFKSSVGSLQLANGVYFYRLKSGDFIETKKMILMK